MEYTLEEIKKHKNRINELSTKLLNAMDINEEILINTEIKKETDFLSSLLNIKKNEINNNMLNQQMFAQQMMQQAMMQQQMMAAQAAAQQTQMNNGINNYHSENKEINIKFNKNGKITYIKMRDDDMVAELINEYLVRTNTKSGNFKFNNRNLSYSDTSLLYEVGLKDNSEIIVS